MLLFYNIKICLTSKRRTSIPPYKDHSLTTVAPNAVNIQYFGRWEKGADTSRCGQGATYIKTNFTGTSIKVLLKDTGNWWRYSIDVKEFKRFKPHGSETTLAENLQPGTHKLVLTRSTEGYMGISEFRGFEIDDGSRLETPDAPKSRRLEFVGDSITAGAKNDGPASGPYNDIEDTDMSYGPQLARLLDADYSIVAKSGEGVIHNWAEPWPGKEVHTSDRYAWTFYYDKFSNTNLKWNVKDFPVDGIVIAMGTNDFSDQKRKPTEAEFVQGYKKLIQTIRHMNPQATIICTEPVPNWVGEKARAWIKESVDTLQAAGDKKLHYIGINENGPLLAESDYAGDSTHPLKGGSAKIAAYLKDKVAAIMGWN